MAADHSEFEEMMRLMGVRPIGSTGFASQPKDAYEDDAISEADRRMFLRAMDALDHRGATWREEPPADLDLPVPEIDDIDEADRELFLKAVEDVNVEDMADAKPRPRTPQPGLVQLKLPKNAKIFWDDTIDLHGKTVEETIEAVASFVPKCFARNYRVIAVITGKGKHNDDGVSVLRPAVENWIRLCGQRYVASYAQAPRKYGGSGALLLYLNK